MYFIQFGTLRDFRLDIDMVLMMKRALQISVILCLFCSALLADIRVDFKNSKKTETIKTIKVNGIEYFAVSELQAVFNAKSITEDRIENKINISIYNESINVLQNSSYASFKGILYNFNYNSFYQNESWYLPTTFIKSTLTTLFPTKLRYNATKGTIEADPVIDSRVKVIVLDPGHGGKDPGAVGATSKEKDITLDMVYLIKSKLENELDDVKVLLTRSKDEFVSLQARTKYANDQHAHLFISVHCNAALAKTSRGIETFFLSTARTTESRAVEALENSVVMDYEGGQEAVKNYDDLQMILADMHQSEQLEESSNLALRIQLALVEGSKAVDRGVKQAGFYVLRGAFMPSVLIELGFITNVEEEKKLLNKDYQNELANSIVQGVKSFKQKYDYIQ
ncbi:MAG TPA: N-acetylmuramoyl-L-alanine amidase [Candidatus Cloacimonadota bacterium]|jgi:N-acetylmuramoyl-L-alanine amidase|nr:N-acetylmuramoyl-L-alanine amidase [Candidatus Cloacimonadales bacterium]HPY97287.1 N-acetylmuramoyl-L-alanine amidase [Candidatus Cloacimonadota bacterium]HQB41776.1 N-acetylmuramoyl-L-alanine amidase [Candidatus Cloacimonadota bacterium]